jgi:Uma2 family endonuclease
MRDMMAQRSTNGRPGKALKNAKPLRRRDTVARGTGTSRAGGGRGPRANLVVMADAARKFATYEDVLNAPEHLVAEVLDGELVLQPRPARRHAHVASDLTTELGPPFRRGRGGPGGWLLLHEPELHLGSPTQILVPDLAGWRLERATFDGEGAFFDVAPDWVCEVLSPATARMDRGRKADIYAEQGVQWLWLIDTEARSVESFRLLDGSWLRIGLFADADARIPPFDAIALDVPALFKFPNEP